MRRIERFDIYLKTKGLNDNIVTNDLGLSVGTIGKSRKVGRDLSDRVIELILNFYTDLSKVWLLTGEGEMLVSTTKVVEAEEIKSDVLPVKCDKPTLGHCAVEPDAICPRGDVARRIPFVSKEIASSPNYDIRKLVREGSPLLDLFPLLKMINGVDYVQTVITMAMAPRYMPGDYLFISFDEGQVHSGKLYLVDTKTYGTVLRHVYKDNVKGGYRLTARNPEFADVFVTFEDVYSVNSVLVHVNTNTSLTSEVNLAEEVRKRDQQIKELTSSQGNLIDAQRQVLVNQTKLIEQLEKQNDRLDKERERTERERERTDKLIDKILRE